MNLPSVITTLIQEVKIDIVKHDEGVFEWVTQSGNFGSAKTFESAAKAIDDARKRF